MGESMKKCLLAAAIMLLASAALARAEERGGLRFAKIIGEGAVLQQGKPTRVWGWAGPRARVIVTITEDEALARPYLTKTDEGAGAGYSVTMRYVERNAPAFTPQTRSAVADARGAWRVEFDAMPAGFTPKYIVAKSGGDGIAIGNVLIGEVWVCAGQSNMGWSNFNRKGREAGSADFPGLRYVAWHDSWYKPLDEVRSSIRWTPCSPKAAEKFSAVPYLFGAFLHRYLKTPVGIINVARGGTLGQTWCMREELGAIDSEIMRTVLAEFDAACAKWDDPVQVERIVAEWRKECDEKRAEYEKKLVEAKAAGKRAPRLRLPREPGDERGGWSPPAGLFNATVMPIRHLGIRGVLYYQGENNNFLRWTRYEHTFPKVPASFRRAFGDDALPFGCISQPGWGTFDLDPEVATVAEGYAIVRDIQRRALAGDPNADMIATYPTGNSYIHPGEKLPVAEYASLWALAKVYKKKVVHRGNMYREMKKKGDKICLFFDSDPVVYNRWKHIKKNAYWQVLPCPREGNAEFKGFIIAGSDRRWYPARAKHARSDGKPCIEVRSDLVADPVAVRYGWANWPTGNMVGRERLPMPTFRTDDWPIPEGVSYSKEAKEKSGAALKDLKATAEKQALDRKIRQMLIDLPQLEHELHVRKNGSTGALVRSKLARIRAVLDELQKDDWLSRTVGKHPELVERLKEVSAAVGAATAVSGGID
jgi:sialate O-acetylesterase